jgi:hypothetical protein
VLNEPGQDDHDGDLELDTSALDGPGRDPQAAGDPDDCPPLDDSKEQVGYELFEWDPSELDELDDVLHELGLAHEWVADGYEVVVHAQDEERVDALLPTIRFPDELPAEDDDGDDTDVHVLSDLFVAADRLHGGASSDAVNGFLDAAEQIGERPPYGLDEKEWGQVVDQVDELIDLFHAAGPAEEITEAAYRLRRRLRPLV